MRRQVKEFQRQHQQAQDPLQQNAANGRQASSNDEPAPKSKTGEYIDFEEVKD